MKRPLAVFGFSFLVVLLAAARWPALVVVPCAVLLGAALLFIKIKKPAYVKPEVGLAAGAALCALLWLFCFNAWVAGPVRALAGRQAEVYARVLEVAPGYGEGTQTATLQVLAVDGKTQGTPFRLEVEGFEDVWPGDMLRAPVRFYAQSGGGAAYAAGKGLYVGARLTGDVKMTGQSHTLATYLRRIQYAAGANILEKLPRRLSAVVAAMSVGDKRFLPAETAADFRAAGLSHTLVVSGLHMAVVCGAAYTGAKLLLRRRRVAAAVSLVLAVLFMGFTGFTPSVVRSGLAFVLVYAARIVNRRADIYTSLGAAALLLCLLNPYAASDVGLLLSFAATVGALAGGRLGTRFKNGKIVPKTTLAHRALAGFCALWAVPVCVTMATLPVLILFGMPVSLLSVPANILAVPLVAPVVLGGLLMALPGLPALGLLGQVGALVAGMCTVLLEAITGFCAGFGGAAVYLTGLVAVAVLLLYPLAYVAAKTRRYVAGVLAGLALFSLAVAGHTVLNYNIVQVELAGNADNPSVVIVQNKMAAVLLRDRRAQYEIEQVLARHGVAQCSLLVDMRQNPQDTAYLPKTPPRQLVLAGPDVRSNGWYAPFGDVEIYLRKQGKGMVACVDVRRYKMAVAQGSVNLGPYGPVDVVLAGRGEVEGTYHTLLCGGGIPEWANDTAKILAAGEGARIQIRPGKSVTFREVQSGGT